MPVTDATMTPLDVLEAEQKRQRRRDRMVMLTLVELLSIIVFVAMAYALATANEGELSRDFRGAYERTLAELEKTKQQLAIVTADRDELEIQARALAEWYDKQRLSPNPQVARKRIKEIVDSLKPLPKTGPGTGPGPGPLVCSSPADLTFEVTLFGDDTLRAMPAWRPDESLVADAPGVADLVAAGRVPRATFMRLADAVRRASMALEEPCIYRINATLTRGVDAELYRLQLVDLEKRFATRKGARAN